LTEAKGRCKDKTEVSNLKIVKEQRDILHDISKRKANWIGHILRRNCLLRQVIEGKIKGGIEVTGRRGRRRRKLLDDLKERRGYSRLKEEVLDRFGCVFIVRRLGRHKINTQPCATQNFINHRPKSACNSAGTEEPPEDGTQMPKHVGATE
jgi:hypothetical protein